jgi:putative addiction module killer protein
MVEVRRTERFAQWLEALRDVRGRARIQARIERLAAGNPGDAACRSSR